MKRNYFPIFEIITWGAFDAILRAYLNKLKHTSSSKQAKIEVLKFKTYFIFLENTETMEIAQFSSRELFSVPQEVVNKISTKELDLSKNNISVLENEFGNLLNLKVSIEIWNFLNMKI